MSFLKTNRMSALVAVGFLCWNGVALAGDDGAKVRPPTAREYPGLPPPPPVMDAEFLSKLKKKTTPEEQSERVDKFNIQMDKAHTFTPEEIVEAKKREVATQRAITYKGAPRKPVSRDVTWTMGSDVPVIHLASGFVTTILFFSSDGSPLPLASQGSIVGDEDAVDNTSVGNSVILYVKKPWVASNMTVFLKGLPIPVQMTLTSELDAAQASSVDYQVRVRIAGSAASTASDRPDLQNIDALMRMVNGMKPIGTYLPIAIQSLEKGDPSRLNWTPIRADIGSFNVGPEGHTYVVFRPGLKLVSPSGAQVIGQLTGADESMGYIVSGNNPRIFTAVDANGAMFRMILQR